MPNTLMKSLNYNIMYEKKIQMNKESRILDIKTKQCLIDEKDRRLKDSKKLRDHLAKELDIRDCAHPKHKGRYDDSKDSPEAILRDLVSKVYEKKREMKYMEGLKIIQRITETAQGLKLYKDAISSGIIDETKIKTEIDESHHSILLIIDTTEKNIKIHLHLKINDEDSALDIKDGNSTYLLYFEEKDERVAKFIKTCLKASFVNDCRNIIYRFDHRHSHPKYLSGIQELIMGDYF